jgi:hypothetical protein
MDQMAGLMLPKSGRLGVIFATAKGGVIFATAFARAKAKQLWKSALETRMLLFTPL